MCKKIWSFYEYTFYSVSGRHVVAKLHHSWCHTCTYHVALLVHVIRHTFPKWRYTVQQLQKNWSFIWKEVITKKRIPVLSWLFVNRCALIVGWNPNAHYCSSLKSNYSSSCIVTNKLYVMILRCCWWLVDIGSCYRAATTGCYSRLQRRLLHASALLTFVMDGNC